MNNCFINESDHEIGEGNSNLEEHYNLALGVNKSNNVGSAHYIENKAPNNGITSVEYR